MLLTAERAVERCTDVYLRCHLVTSMRPKTRSCEEERDVNPGSDTREVLTYPFSKLVYTMESWALAHSSADHVIAALVEQITTTNPQLALGLS